MANGKSNTSKLAIVSAMPEAEANLIDRVRELGTQKGSGDASWEGLADIVIEGCQGTWKAEDFTAKRGADPVKDVAAIVINAFYDGACAVNKKLVRPVGLSLKPRLSNVRTIGKAACKWDKGFKDSLRGPKGIVDKHLIAALAKPKQSASGKTIQPYSAFEVICRTAAAAVKKQDSLTFSDAEIQRFLYSKDTPKATGLQALVDEIGRMVTALGRATNGYKEKKGDVETDVPAVCSDKELIAAHKSLATWHAANKSKGTQKKTRGKAVNFADIDPVEMQAQLAAMGYKVTKTK